MTNAVTALPQPATGTLQRYVLKERVVASR